MKKKKDKIVIEELRDEITSLNGRITNLEEEIRALTFYHVNPDGLVFSQTCYVNQETTQCDGGKVFNHGLFATFIDPKTMRVVKRELVKHYGQIQIQIKQHKYDIGTGHLTLYLNITQNKEVQEYKIEHNLHCFFASSVVTLSMQTETNPLKYPNWVKIPANIEKGTLIFS